MPGMGSTGTNRITGSNIRNMPGRGAASVVTSVEGIQTHNRRNGTVKGSRSGSTDTYIDGVKVRGSSSLPQAAYDQVQIITSGVPAQFENTSGSVLSINTQPNGSLGTYSTTTSRTSSKRKKKRLKSEGLNAGHDLYRQQSFKNVFAEPLSTFSIDVDAASYSQIRRSLNMGALPPVEIVRIEEMINYFKYDYEQPEDGDPFSITTEVAVCPWNSANKLVHIGLQGKELQLETRPKNNLIFLIDVSGSMSSHDKLPLLKQSLRLLVKELEETDKISIVVYAGAAGLILPSTSGDKKGKLLEAIDRLNSGGSTAGGAGIQLAYSIAEKEFIKSGNNRIILCTDGDFNVGVSSDEGLEKLIERKRESGVFLTVLGFGTGNFQDHKMETLADKGNGNFSYIDNLQEAQKVLVQEFWGTLFTIAKDVKIQVEFNPVNVLAYRLIGYENRRLAAEDFNDDRKDAGELGAGHTVTALYEVIPAGGQLPDGRPLVDTLKYQLAKPTLAAGHNDELLTVKLRYKNPDGDVSKLLIKPLANQSSELDSSSANMRFSASMAQFGMILLDKKLEATQRLGQIEKVIEMAQKSKGPDEDGRRAEFIRLAELAMIIE
jgi:Ca-activated chloride channel family protein